MADEHKKKPKKTTLYLDEGLLREAAAVTGANATETVRQGLEAIVRNAAYQRMRGLLGSEAGRPIRDVPRLREPPAAKAAPRRKLKKSA